MMKITCCIVLFASIIQFVYSLENYRVLVTKVVCINVNDIYFAEYNCFTKPYNRTLQLITVDLTLRDTAPPLSELFIHYIAYYKFNTYKPILIDKEEDFCGYMNGTARAPLLNMIYPSVIKYSTLNHTCPYLPKEKVGQYNMVVDDTPFPPIIPSGDYRMDGHFRTIHNNKKILIGSVESYVSVIPKGAKQLKMG